MSNHWVNLHSHDIFSLLDGYGKQEQYAERVVELGDPALATTNHGNLFGIYKHYKTCKKYGIKPILGIELYQARKSRTDRDDEERAGPSTSEWGQRGPHHLTVLARNNTGYGNLLKLSSRAYLEGYFVKPRADMELLADHADGLIILSGCLSGQVQQALLRGDYQSALLHAATMQEIVGPENYFIEIMDHGIPEEKAVMADLVRIAKTIGAKMVPTNDTHYVNKEDHDNHDTMLCVGTRSTKEAEERFKFSGPHFYLKSREEMEQLFEPSWLDNTLHVAEMCEVDIDFDTLHFPSFPGVPKGKTPDDFFIEEAWRGMHERFGEEIPQDYREQAEYELGVIKEMGFQEYFLVVSDLIRAAKDNGVNIGWGRGCLTPEVPVWTPHGFKPISEIRTGDRVIGHSGKMRLVKDTFVYDVDEEMVRLRSYMDDTDTPVQLTADHKVLIERGRETSRYQNGGTLTKRSVRRWELPTGKVDWVESGKVEPGDWVVVPKPELVQYEFSMNLSKFLYSMPSAILSDGSTGVYEKHQKREFDQYLKSFVYWNEDFVYFLGRFAADGWIRSDRPTIGICDQRSKKFDMPGLIRKIFGPDVRIDTQEHPDRDLVQWTITSEVITTLMRQRFNEYESTPHSKHVPSVVFQLPDNERLAFLRGYWDGDGHFSSKKARAVTVSEKLAWGIRTLMWTLGIPNGVHLDSREDDRPGYENRSTAYVITAPSGLTPSKWARTYVDDNNIYMQVMSTERFQYKGKVHDFEVEEDHSFLTSSFVVHNSAAASVIAYAMQITNLDPIKFGLLFERFLTPGRVSMPDIDIDTDNREWMLNYTKEKYGRERVAQISTFAEVKPKSAIRDAARVLGYEASVGDKIAKLVPGAVLGKDKSIEEVMAHPDIIKEYNSNADSKKILDAAVGLVGLVRQPGIHAAGVVIAPTDVTDYVPVMISKEGGDTTTTQCDMYEVEDLGLLKMDYLGLRNLRVIDDTIKLVNKRHNLNLVRDELPLDDAKTYKMLQAGHSIGVFQVEGGGLREIMVDMRPDNINDIMALIALYRPGPMGSGMHRMYIERKRGRAPIEAPHPLLKPVLEKSLGIMLYQEDVLRVITTLAGWSVGEADDLRRVIGKKKMDEVASYREKFVEGCVKTHQVPKPLADKIFSDIEYFAGYGFNLAHSASYAMVTYATAYLKANYPVEYMASLLTSVVDKPDKLALYLRECKDMGIEVLPPSILVSEEAFTVESDNQIRFGLIAIRGVGESIVNNMVSSRSLYNNIYELMRQVDVNVLNSGTVGHLVKSGALDELVDAESIRMTASEKRNYLLDERVALGVYITQHPLDDVIHAISPICDSTIEDLSKQMDNSYVKIAGIVTTIQKKSTKRGGNMYILGFEDLTGSIEVIVFPKLFPDWEGKFTVGDIVIMDGRLGRDVKENDDGSVETIHKLYFSNMITPDLPETSEQPIIIPLRFKPTYDMLVMMEKLMEANPGDSEVFISYEDDGKTVELKFRKRTDYGVVEDLKTLGLTYA